METCKLNGLDDFLTGIAPLLEGDPLDEQNDVDCDLDSH